MFTKKTKRTISSGIIKWKDINNITCRYDYLLIEYENNKTVSLMISDLETTEQSIGDLIYKYGRLIINRDQYLLDKLKKPKQGNKYTKPKAKRK